MKKLVSFLLLASMLVAAGSTAMAKFEQPQVVSYFDTMLGYKSGPSDAELPSGWKTLFDAGHTGEVSRAKLADNLYEDNTNVLRLNGSSANWGAAMRFPFTEVIKTGKVHAGFDMKVSNGTQVRFGGHYVQSGNYNPDDYTGGEGRNWTEKNTFLLLNNNGFLSTYQPTNLDTNENNRNIDSVSNGAWNRYDLYIDTENHSYDVYLNGINKGTFDLSRYELKSFWFQCDTGVAYVDNICFNHYQSGNFDPIKMSVDYSENGVALQDGAVNVSFTELVSEEYYPMASDFVAKNTKTGTEYDAEEVEIADNGSYIIYFGDLAEGTYELSVSNQITGAISGTSVSDKAVFSTAPESLNNVGHYYMNEDFESYNGGMPAGWGKGDSNGYAWGYSKGEAAKISETEGRNSETAAEFESATGEQSYEYKFPTTMYDGKFVIEFDIYHSKSARWAMGLLTPAEYTNELVTTDFRAEDLYKDKDAAWWASQDGISARNGNLNTRRVNTVLLAQYQADSGEYTRLNAGKGLTSWFDDVVSGVSVPGDEWTHVKAVIDSDSNEYRVTATDQTGNVTSGMVTGVSRLVRQQLYNVTTGKNEYVWGIAGLRLLINKNETGTVKLDNIKVYADTDKAYNLYEDYNTLVSQNTPYNNRFSLNWARYFDGVTRSTNNNAMKINFPASQTSMFFQPLSVPVKAGRSLNVSFDIKNESVSNNNNDTEGRWELVLGNWDSVKNEAYYYDLNRIISRSTAGGNLKAIDSAGTWQDTGIAWRTGEWHHIDALIDNSGDTARIKLQVTYANGDKSVEYTGTTKNELKSLDVTYFGIRAPWNCTSPITLDNVKISETDTTKASVTSIKAVNYADEKTDINGTVSAASKALEINLSQPISDTTAVSLAYVDMGTDKSGKYINCTKTLLNGGRTICVEFDTIPELERDIAVEIKQNASFTNSYMTNFTAYQNVFKLAAATDGKIEVTEFRVFMHQDSRTDAQGHVYEGRWVPYYGDAFSILSDSSNLKVVAKGYNTGDTAEILMSANEYSIDEENISKLVTSEIKPITVPTGNFEEEFTDLPFSENVQIFKAMIWTNPEFAPLHKALSYDR